MIRCCGCYVSERRWQSKLEGNRRWRKMHIASGNAVNNKQQQQLLKFPRIRRRVNPDVALPREVLKEVFVLIHDAKTLTRSSDETNFRWETNFQSSTTTTELLWSANYGIQYFTTWNMTKGFGSLLAKRAFRGYQNIFIQSHGEHCTIV